MEAISAEHMRAAHVKTALSGDHGQNRVRAAVGAVVLDGGEAEA
jgi:hypothetical protein